MPQQVDESAQDTDEIDEMRIKIISFSLLLENVENITRNSLQSIETHIIDHGLTADTVVLNNDAFVNNLYTNSINNIDINRLLDQTINVNDGFQLNVAEFETIRIEGETIPKTFNGHDSTALLHLTDDLMLDELIVNGDVLANNGVMVQGKINNNLVIDENILLVSGDQEFLGDNITIKSTQVNNNIVEIDNIDAKFLNGIDLLSTLSPLINDKINVDKLNKLTVKTFVIGGFINDVDFRTLDKYALRKQGDQEISEKYVFDSIEANNMVIRDGLLSGRNIFDDLILIDDGDYDIEQDIMFNNDELTVNNLEIRKNLNGIRVINNDKLDILLTNSNTTQHVTGHKTFQNLNLLNPIKLQGKIKSRELEKINPVITIDKMLEFDGDYIVTGDIFVEQFLVTDDIVTSDSLYSLRKLETDGLALTDKEIPVHLDFVQQLNLDEIFVDKINGIDADNLVINGYNQTQIIQGGKLFNGDVYITGETNAFKINDVNVSELDSNVMKSNGDQTIEGKHNVKRLITTKKITSSNIKFGPNPWISLVTIDSDQTITGTTLVKNNVLITDTIKADKIIAEGLINGINFTEIILDTVTTTNNNNNTNIEKNIIRGEKQFKNLTIEELTVVNNGIDFDEMINSNFDDLIRIKGPIKIPQLNSKTENIYFTDRFNGLEYNQLTTSDEEYSKLPRNISDEQVFDTIIIYGEAIIKSNQINDIDLNDLVNNTIKIDEEFNFNTTTVTFRKS